MLSQLIEDGADALEELADCELLIGGSTTPVSAIWDAPYSQPFGMMDANVPAAVLSVASAAAVLRGTVVTRAGTQYRVIGIEPDGHGLVTLRLEQV